tara:strand:+ start:278 stop:574 length:297 start_codon:yes stop_codon:yes gene_type:complete
MSSVMKAMQAAHKHQRLKERIEEDAMLAQEKADRAWRGDPKRKEQLLAARAAEATEAVEAEKPKAKKKAAPEKKAVAKKKAAPKKKTKAKKKSAAKKG